MNNGSNYVAESDLDQVIEQYHLALSEFVKGNSEPVRNIWSQRDDVSLANPLRPVALGWKQVEDTLQRAASGVRDGEVHFEIIVKRMTPDMAFVVWFEHVKARINNSETHVPFALRVTNIFQPEGGTWKLVHRHADPITSERPMESLIQN